MSIFINIDFFILYGWGGKDMNLTLNELANEAFKNNTSSYRTTQIYMNNYEKFWKDMFGNMKCNNILIDEIGGHLQELTLFYSENTLKIIRNSLSCVFNYGYDHNILTKKPNFKLIKLYNQRHLSKIKLIKYSDFIGLLDYIKYGRSKNAQSFYIALCIMRYTGCRLSECLALLTSDINLEDDTITINKQVGQRKINNISVITIEDTKTPSSNRIVYMNSTLKHILKEYIHYHFNDILLPDSNNSYICPTLLSSHINYYAKTRGKVITAHMLRHTFATVLLQHNIPADIVKDLLGHSSVQTTLDLYVHRNKYEYLNAVNVLSEDSCWEMI